MRIVFMGTPQAAVPSLAKLLEDEHDVAAVYTQPDRPSGRGNKITFSPVKQFALEKGIAVLQPTKIKTPEALEEFRSLAADIAVVVAYGRILPETFLNAFPGGAVNVHFSLLPKYRGAAPVNWAIVNGDTGTGVTTMKMDAGLDTGDILLQRDVPIGERENSVDLMDRLSLIGAELLSETLFSFVRIEPQRQNHSRATHAPIMKKEDGRFDWTMPADEIARRVRGFQPFPTTYASFDGRKLTLWDVEAVEHGESNKEPATILSANADELTVQAGAGSAVRIHELQLEGKRRMSARDFLNGVKVKEGDKLT